MRVVDDGRIVEEQKDVTVCEKGRIDDALRDAEPREGAEEAGKRRCEVEHRDDDNRAYYPKAEQKAARETVSVKRDVDPPHVPCSHRLFSAEEELDARSGRPR